MLYKWPSKSLAGIALLVFLLVSCTGMKTSFYPKVEKNLWSGNYSQASSTLKKSKKTFGKKNAVLFHLEAGLLDHYAGNYKQSNKHLLAAEKEMQRLYTKSITTSLASMITNDNELPYEGENFEKVMVNLFLSLNFIQMGNLESALVEARKVDVKLNEFSREYDGKNVYKEDAFVRYLMGTIYEAEGELNDAYISYIKAYKAFELYEKQFNTPLPESLKHDLVRLAGELGFDDEKEEFEEEFNLSARQSGQTSTGSIVVIIYSGKSPIKKEIKIKPTIYDKDAVPHTFAIAVPKFKAREKRNRSYQVRLNSPMNSQLHKAERFQDITKIAEKDLQDRIDLIYLKAGGRAVLKFLAVEALKKETKGDSKVANFFVGSLLDATYKASEKADVRTWRSLPNQIQVARLVAPPGKYQLKLSSGSRKLLSKPVEVKANQVAYKIYSDVN
jgi:hypothetical protein